jgi:hypothetical protein
MIAAYALWLAGDFHSPRYRRTPSISTNANAGFPLRFCRRYPGCFSVLAMTTLPSPNHTGEPLGIYRYTFGHLGNGPAATAWQPSK